MAKLDQYQKYLSSLGLKDSTIKNYIWQIRQFLQWLDKTPISDAKLKSYHQVIIGQQASVASVNLRLICINKYLKWLNRPWQFDLLQHQESDIQFLNKKQLDKFLAMPSNSSRLIARRDRSLLTLLYSTGLKVGQITKLKLSDIDDVKQELFFDNRQIPLSASTWLYLQKYTNKRRDDNPWLFINLDRAGKQTDAALSIRSVERILDKYARALYPPLRVTPQILRNTLAWQLKNQGASVANIAQSLYFKSKPGAKHYFAKI